MALHGSLLIYIMAHNTQSVPISKRLVLINSASNVVTRLLTVGVFAWVIQHLIHRVPANEVAIMWVVMSVTLMLPVVQGVLTAGLGRFITEAYAKNDLEGVTQIVSSLTPLLVMAAAVLLCLGGLAAWGLPHLLDIAPELFGTFRFMLIVVVARMALGLCVAALQTGLFVKQRFVLRNVLQVLGSIVTITFMLALILGVGPNVEWVIISQVAGQVWVTLSTLVVSLHIMPALRFRPSKFRWDVAHDVICFGGWHSLGQLARSIRQSADAPILQGLASSAAVNNFAIGAFIDTQIRQLTIMMGIPVSPALIAMHARGQNRRLTSAYVRGGRLLLWISMFVAVPLIILRVELLQIYVGDAYPSYSSAATVLALLLLAYPITYPSAMLIKIMHAKGNVGPFTKRSLAAQAFNLCMTLALVGWFEMGAVGAALSTLLTAFLGQMGLQWPLAHRELNVSWQRFCQDTLFRGLMPAVGSGASLLLLRTFVPVRNIWILVLCAGVHAVIYAALVAWQSTSLDRRDFRQALNTMVARRRLSANDKEVVRV